MTIRYEANPPKILPDVNTDESIIKFIEKMKIISKKCDSIHITENVLGYERVSPIKIGEIIKKEIPNISITVSLRVRDKT
ncbi:5,10-methenyltetrahydrofolate synthetase, partial [Nitrosopumilus sp.]|nr:5,10-methenyltetrahydrofolate synthetase [Nitrosopumilus sp.]